MKWWEKTVPNRRKMTLAGACFAGVLPVAQGFLENGFGWDFCESLARSKRVSRVRYEEGSVRWANLSSEQLCEGMRKMRSAHGTNWARELPPVHDQARAIRPLRSPSTRRHLHEATDKRRNAYFRARHRASLGTSRGLTRKERYSLRRDPSFYRTG
ncbi:hypothetical protein GQ53DRAFT_112334 [Thozetella sp. PMI_491]|nr:hypothetical protein GQ53DRAFT_112334 [Thozetella sp. PMI_491]